MSIRKILVVLAAACVGAAFACLQGCVPIAPPEPIPSPCDTSDEHDVVIEQFNGEDLVLANDDVSSLITFHMWTCVPVRPPLFRFTIEAIGGSVRPGGEPLINTVGSDQLALDLRSVTISDASASMLWFLGDVPPPPGNWYEITGTAAPSGSGRVELTLVPEGTFRYDDGTPVPDSRISGASSIVTLVTVGTP